MLSGFQNTGVSSPWLNLLSIIFDTVVNEIAFSLIVHYCIEKIDFCTLILYLEISLDLLVLPVFFAGVFRGFNI